MAHDSPHHPLLCCLAPTWAVALPVSTLKHSPARFSGLEGEMEIQSFCCCCFILAQTNLNFHKLRALNIQDVEKQSKTRIFYHYTKCNVFSPSVFLSLCGNLVALLSQIFTRDFNRPRFQPLLATVNTNVMAVTMITSTENWCLEKITVHMQPF